MLRDVEKTIGNLIGKENTAFISSVDSKEMIWPEGGALHNPLGATGPGYCVLRPTAAEGRYCNTLDSESLGIG